jgi:DNA-binding Lrp family transcriptional regulator
MGRGAMTEPLDQFDRSILEIVQRDCQIKAEAIGEMIGLSASAVQRRLKRMREERIISAEIAVVDRKVAGNPMTFIAGMEIERENYDALSKFRTWVAKQDHIQQVYYVTGSVDLVAIITAQDVGQYDEITAQIMSQNPQIKRIHTNVVLKDIKLGMFVPMEP